MSSRLGLLLVLVFGAFVAYLTAQNSARIRLALAPDWALDLPVIAVVVGAFFAGALVVLLLILFRDLGRWLHDWKGSHRARQAERLREIFERGAGSQRAGRADEAMAAYQEVLSREPGHAGAHLGLGELARARGNHLAALDHHLQALQGEERPDTLMALALDYKRAGRPDDAVVIYRRLLQQDPDHLAALRALRELAASQDRWADALLAQQRLVHLVTEAEQAAELGWLAGIRYEIGKALLGEGKAKEALIHFRDAVRADRGFLPASVALGDAHLRAGDRREAIRTWERAAEATPSPVLLRRLEQAYRAEERPSRMIALYREAIGRAPQEPALAFQLGRVYFELEMLDEAADQFQKVEVQGPDLAPLHAYLGAIFERRGQAVQAFQEYRRALALAGTFDWPYRCSACGIAQAGWQDRCPGCRRWNTSFP